MSNFHKSTDVIYDQIMDRLGCLWNNPGRLSFYNENESVVKIFNNKMEDILKEVRELVDLSKE